MRNYDSVPRHMRAAIQNYLEDGQRPGGFLTALLSNDLMEAFNRADPANPQPMRAWVHFLRNELPIDSYGSPENFNRWIERGGVQGNVPQVAEQAAE